MIRADWAGRSIEAQKGTVACHQTGEKPASSLGGMLGSVAVLRGFLKRLRNYDGLVKAMGITETSSNSQSLPLAAIEESLS
jgi:hypothetical protein